ncbi:MAG: phage tail protein [Pedobacter sp.]
MLSVRLEGLDKAMRIFDERIVSRAASQTINETVRGVCTSTNKEIRQEWNVKSADLSKKLRAIKMARATDLEGIVEARSTSLSLSYFGAKSYSGTMVQTRTVGKRLKRSSSRSGVYVQIKRGEGQTHKKNAFMTAVKAGKGGGYHIGVFERVGKSRLPIVERKVITVASMFNQEPVQRVAIKTIDDVFPRRFNHHIDRLMSK